MLFNYGLADITPDEPLLLAGYANRTGLSSAVHRRLTTRCVVLKQEQTIVCLIANDLMDVDPKIIGIIIAKIIGKTGIDPAAILITSIHTHSAPETEYGRSDANDRYVRFLIKTVARNAIDVIKGDTRFRRATQSFGKAVCDINIARRDVKPEDGGMAYRVGDPDGIKDREVSIIQLTDDEHIRKVTLFNYACHPVILGYESNYVSTDYPGRAREVVEGKYGGMAVFLNGAAGDLNPRLAHQVDPSIADSEGEKLGNAVLSAELVGYGSEPDLAMTARVIHIPFRDQVITKKHIEQEVERKASDITEFFTWNEMLDRWKKKVFEMIGEKKVKDSFPFKLNAVKLGNCVIFLTQGELFVKYQLELKKRFPGYHMLCIAYVHGIGAYIPTSEAFENKSYEADQAYIYEVMPSPLTPEIEKIYIEEASQMINDLINT